MGGIKWDGRNLGSGQRDGKLYITGEEGSGITVRAGVNLEVLARSDLGEEIMSTPAISAGTIYFRSRGHLTAVGL